MNKLPSLKKATAFLRQHLPKRQHRHVKLIGPMLSAIKLEFYLPPEPKTFGKYGRVVIAPEGSVGLAFTVAEPYTEMYDPEQWVVVALPDGEYHIWESWHGDWRPMTVLEQMAYLGEAE